MAIVVGVTGLAKLGATNASLQTVHNERLVALADLSRVPTLMQQNQSTLLRAALEGGDSSAAVTDVEGRIQQISSLHRQQHPVRRTGTEADHRGPARRPKRTCRP